LGGSARALECRSVMVFLDRWIASRINDITGRAGPAGMEVLGTAVRGGIRCRLTILMPCLMACVCCRSSADLVRIAQIGKQESCFACGLFQLGKHRC
jgi:hypothetical protein